MLDTHRGTTHLVVNAFDAAQLGVLDGAIGDALASPRNDDTRWKRTEG